MNTQAKPFLKWAGGKTRLLGEILPALPLRIDTYYETFLGSGAVYFALANERRFRRAVLGDRNPEVINAHIVVRDHLEALIRLLRFHSYYADDKIYYSTLSCANPAHLSDVQRAARFIFLNKLCYNGLYRENAAGRFNVSRGRYVRPRICDDERLTAASRALAGAELVVSDFAELARHAGCWDAIYFDPPYVPISATSSFANYLGGGFSAHDQVRLARVYRACLARGAHALLSNSGAQFARVLYRGLNVRTVQAARAINSIAARRGPVSEILVCGARTELP